MRSYARRWDFLDPATSEVMTVLAEAAQTGALLITCRYPVPGPDRFLAEVPVPALSPAELRRMFLHLPPSWPSLRSAAPR